MPREVCFIVHDVSLVTGIDLAFSISRPVCILDTGYIFYICDEYAATGLLLLRLPLLLPRLELLLPPRLFDLFLDVFRLFCCCPPKLLMLVVYTYFTVSILFL